MPLSAVIFPNLNLAQIDALILGCTHYPIIKNQISKYYNFEVDVIDSSRIVANHLRNLLIENQQLSQQAKPATPVPGFRFYRLFPGDFKIVF